MKMIRLEKIMNILKRKGYATIEELAKSLEVSKVTIRRDLAFLESQGLIEKRRGGAILREIHYEIPFFIKLEKDKDKKIRIAEETVKLFKDGQNVFAMGGTTIYYTMQALERANIKDLTIITNSITTAWAVINLTKPVFLLHTGGRVRRGSFECIGGHVMRFVEDLNVDVFLMGIDGISIEKGLTVMNYEESLIAKRVLTNAEVKIVVADDSKFGKIAPYKVANVDDVSFIITSDSEKIRKLKRFFEKVKVNFIIV